MLEINDQEYFDEVIAFSKTLPDKLQRTLKDILQRFRGAKGTYILYRDFAPHSFYFRYSASRSDLFPDYVGGVIFHGNVDGYGSGTAPTFSVTLDTAEGWRVHT
jgi:hypothetical protein